MSTSTATHDYGDDIFTEPDAHPDTLANLGPLAGMAGVWSSDDGHNVHPVGPGSDIKGTVVDGNEHSPFVEHYDLQPIDPQTNGPQLFYGLRYHTHITRPGEVETFHDQVGYWLWEPAAQLVWLTVAIPRAQVVLASGPATADAKTFTVTATRGSTSQGIVSNPFLEKNFTTVEFRMTVTINDDGTWSYEEHTMMEMPDRPGPVDHIDRNTLHRVAAPTPNPLAGEG